MKNLPAESILEERRIRSDLIETFKIVNRKYDINPELFFQLHEGDRRGHDQKLFKKRFRLNVRKYAFSNRVIDNWNLLPGGCINCSTINTFKKHLSSELVPKSFTLPFRPWQAGLQVVVLGGDGRRQ